MFYAQPNVGLISRMQIIEFEMQIIVTIKLWPLPWHYH